MEKILSANLDYLRRNPYPGRGIIQGLTPDEKHLVQVYWLMGRSENSRNRILVNENGFVKTKVWDEKKVTDPSLIIYYPVKFIAGCHIVSNGDQTDTIYDAVRHGETFEDALNTRAFEPDSPNYTPRISGIINLGDDQYAYRLSIIKPLYNDPEYCLRQFFLYERAVPGIGHCLHTYAGDGDPLPAFNGEPYPVKLFNDPEETAEFYWQALNSTNKVALLVKFIDAKTGATNLVIINRHQ